MVLMLLCQQPPCLRGHPKPTSIELSKYKKVDAADSCKTFLYKGAKKITTPTGIGKLRYNALASEFLDNNT